MESSKDRLLAENASSHKISSVGFPRSARLLKPADFKRVFKKSTVSSDRYFKVLACPNDMNRARLGMAVSRQVDKHAVGRNRIKRVIRESFRQTFMQGAEGATDSISPDATASNQMDLVVLPRRECATISNPCLFASIEAHWSRLDRKLQSKVAGSHKANRRNRVRRMNQDAGKT